MMNSRHSYIVAIKQLIRNIVTFLSFVFLFAIAVFDLHAFQAFESFLKYCKKNNHVRYAMSNTRAQNQIFTVRLTLTPKFSSIKS